MKYVDFLWKVHRKERKVQEEWEKNKKIAFVEDKSVSRKERNLCTITLILFEYLFVRILHASLTCFNTTSALPSTVSRMLVTFTTTSVIAIWSNLLD